ncbi:MAG TPA: hypothetical protein VMH23_02780 [Bacteroidota bacterium]|nr:hypothetical protein [Bacteroidota bacterium]
MLTLIKSIHTAIWILMTSAIFYIGFCVMMMAFGTLFYVALALVGSEILVILVNHWRCPLTGVARRYSDEESPNFDIFLPRTIAQYNKEIFTVILLVILVMYLVQALR